MGLGVASGTPCVGQHCELALSIPEEPVCGGC